MAGLQPQATSTMNYAATLMTPHRWPGFNPGNISHELCHHTDGVTHDRLSFPATVGNPNTILGS
jgi:hypothetical protein